MLREIQEAGEQTHFGIFALARKSFPRYIEMLNILRLRDDPTQGMYPIHSFFIYQYDQLAGEVRLRKRLPHETADIGNHIYLYVRPTMRRRGVGGTAFRETLAQAQQLRIITMLNGAFSSNIAALAILQRSGGVPIKDIEMPNGIFKRFRFFLPKPV